MKFDFSLIPTLCLFAMMLSMGMTLRVADFRRLFEQPGVVAFGVLGQLVLLPLVAFGIALGLGLSDTVAIGLVLISACPGGVTSNAVAHIARGDTALSITLTAVSSMLAFAWVPVILSLGFRTFGAAGSAVELSPLETALTLFSSTALPVMLGMLVLHRAPERAARWQNPLLYGSASILSLLILALGYTLWTEEEDLVGLLVRAGPAVILLLLSMTAIALAGGRALGLSLAQTRTIAIELTMQNFNLALVVAVTLLGEPLYAGVAVIYLPIMFGFAGALAFRGARGSDTTPP